MNRLVAAVWLLAFAVRCVYVWQISSAPFFDLRLGDAEAYHTWARRITAGDWLGRDVFYQAPLYPYFLAILYRIVGEAPAVLRLIHAAIGATSCAFVASAGISLFGPLGVLAGLGLAIYPPAIFLDALLEKSVLVTLFTSALVATLAAGSDRMTLRRSMAAGVILALLALTRENALLLIVPVLLWVAAGPAAPRGVLAAAGACVVVLGLVGARNYTAGGEFHLTTSQFGPNFYIGNRRGASGTYEALVVGHGSVADERDDATRLAEHAAGRSLGPDEVSSYWTRRALAEIRADPAGWVTLALRKALLTINAAEIADTESPQVYAEWSSLLRLLAPFDFGAVLVVGVPGALLTAHRWRRLWFLYAIGATYALSVVMFYVFGRYRFPLVPVLLLLAAGGIAELARVRMPNATGPGPVRAIAAVAAMVLALAASRLPLEDPRPARAVHYAGIATALRVDPTRRDQAIDFYRRALAEAPEYPPAHMGIGVLLAELERPAEAIPHYTAALESWPDYAEARYNLGRALAAAGRAEEASQQFRDALRLRPDDVDTHLALARTLLTIDQPEGAAQHYARVLSLQPDNNTALVGAGVALTQLGRPDEAIERYRRALQLNPRNDNAHNSLGWTLASGGRIAEAVPHFQRALEINPANLNARRNLEQVQQLQK
jgi:Tfp pilus assembly protein PilF